MNKLNISIIVGIVTLLGVFSSLVLKFGGLPQAIASLSERVEKAEDHYQNLSKDITEIGAEQKYIKEKLDDQFEFLKSKL